MTKLKTSEHLAYAKSFIDTPEKWTTKADARDHTGGEVNPISPWACKFCSEGALLKAHSNESPTQHAFNALTAVMNESIIKFNDSHTHSEVMEAWDRAIALLKKVEQ